MSKFGRKMRDPPAGFEDVEPTLTALDNELREKVNEPHEGLRKNESQWPVFQINWQKSRYIYDMYYTYERISRPVYDFCVNNKLVDAALIAKWKKPGYERLCSTYTINPRNYKFGTVSICRVPKHNLPPGSEIEDPTTGCRGCASGPGGVKNIFGNKYGQYLAAIQVAREERAYQRQLEEEEEDDDDSDDDGAGPQPAPPELDGGAEESKSGDLSGTTGKRGRDADRDMYDGPVGAADGSSGKSKSTVWAGDEEEDVQLEDSMIGELQGDAEREGRAAARNVGKMGPPSGGGHFKKPRY